MPKQAPPPVDCSRLREYSSCAIGIATLIGRMAGAAVACGVPPDRIGNVVEAVGDRMRQVSTSPKDLADALALFRATMEISHRAAPASDCPGTALAFQEIERNIGRR